MSLNETVFEGWVSHQRRFDVNHGFKYKVWMVLAEMSGSKLPRLVQPNWAGYISRAEVLEMAKCPESARVFLLTQPSLFSRSFNPVSFFYVVKQDTLISVIAHITNTPWDEKHCYVLDARNTNEWTFDKAFHVSPYMPMQMQYKWRLKTTANQLLITMQLLDHESCAFAAALSLKAVASNRLACLRLRLRYPLQNTVTLLRIYWQALILKFKGARFHAHPNSADTTARIAPSD